MAIKNYTTKINPERTIAEIQSLLAAKGARQINVDYSEAGKPEAVHFGLMVRNCPVYFRLPRNANGVLAAMKKGGLGNSFLTAAHAESVSWRIVKDWIEAQLAIVEAGQAEMAQVFLPYAMRGEDGLTLYDQFLSNIKALPEKTA